MQESEKKDDLKEMNEMEWMFVAKNKNEMKCVANK